MEKSAEFSAVDSISRFVDFEKLQGSFLLDLGDQLDKLKACQEPDHNDITVILAHLRALYFSRNHHLMLTGQDINVELLIKLKDFAFALLTQTDVDRKETFGKVCELLTIAIELCDQNHSQILMNEFLGASIDSLLRTCTASNVEPSTITSVEYVDSAEKLKIHGFSIDSIVESLCFLLDNSLEKTSNSNKFVTAITNDNSVQQLRFAQLKTLLVKSLSEFSEHLLIKVLLDLLPKINAVEKLPEAFQTLVSGVWDVVMQSFNSELGETPKCASRGYLILSCICEYVFPPRHSNNTLPIWANCQFWEVLQNSLVHENPLQRKRALYFLKRVLDGLQNEDIDIPASSCGYLFSWKCDQSVEIQKAFYNMMLVLETLEEKQVHVLKPLFPVVHNLISSSIENESWFLHPSWLMVLFQRLLQHDSKTAKKWAIDMICEINLNDVPLIVQTSAKFFWTSFLEGLNDNALYARQPNEPLASCANIGNKLMKHYKSCYVALKTDQKRATFYQHILKNLQNQSWGSVPLLHITRALTGIPPGLLWNSTSANDLREVLTNSMRAHEIAIRGAVQGFLLEAFMHLINVSELTINDLSLVIGTFKKKECLQRCTGLYANLVLWLRQAIHDADKQQYELRVENVLQFIELSLHNILEEAQGITVEELKDSCEISRTARMMVLLFDAKIPGLSFGEKNMHPSLEKLIDALKTCHSRPYMTPGKAEKCLAFLLTLAAEAECNSSVCPDGVQKCITAIFEEVSPYFLPYVVEKLFSYADDDNEHFGNIQLYFHFLEHMAKDAALHLSLQDHLSNLCQKSIEELRKKECTQSFFLQHYIAIKCFHTACAFVEISFNAENACQNLHMKDFMDVYMKGNLLSDVPKDKSNISFADKVHKTVHLHSDYIAMLWSCICFCLEKCNFAKAIEQEIILQQSSQAIEVCSEIAFKPIFTCLESCLAQIVEREPEKVLVTLEVCWKTVSNMKINAAFWDTIDAFIKMAFQQALISNVDLVPHLSKYAANIAERSETCHGLFLLLIRKLVAIWKMPEHELSMLNYMPVLVQALTFGHIHRRDQRISQDTIKFLSTLGNYYAQVQDRSLASDSEVRVEAIILLLHLRKSPHFDEIASALVHDLLKFEAKITKSRSRHFANSLIHRVKQRVWQTLLVLQPLLTEELCESIMNTSFKMIVEESLQPSVRYLMEWLILKILHEHPAKIPSLWSSFAWATQCRVGSLGSFLSIICHLGNLLKNMEQQISFIENAFPAVLPWCMAQHFNTRIYAQVTLHKLWKCCKKNHFESLLEKYSPMESLFSINIEHSGTSKGIQNLLEDYNFNAFHQIQHYSIATIFYELPRLCNVTEEEWIEPEAFAKCDPLGLFKSAELYLPLYNPDNILSQCAPGSWINRSTGDVVLSSDTQENKDVQKKLTPWKQMIPDYEALMAASQSISWKKHQNTDGLIVVASLIDRAPNLGGLCRTCEVFGVTAYVIGNLRYTEDKQFQSLSVSAERWVQIEEVKPQDLREYLLTSKKRGYTIIGAEQTANSRKLGNFTFPKKTVLLLGNEKEGIPVELIQLLDICVEIPQEGLIRSLNVHVTGAILIWEYVRQKYFS